MPNEATRQGEMTINEEANLPANWVPLDLPPIIPGVTPAMPSNKTPRYLQGTVPPATQHDSSLVGTAYETPNIPQLTMMPLGVQGSPMTNAGIQSTAVKSAPSSSSSGSTKIELQIPNIFTPIDQIVALPGPLMVDLADELPGTVFAGPVPINTVYFIDTESMFVGQNTATIIPYNGPTTHTWSTTPSLSPEFAILLYNTEGTSTQNVPTGWATLVQGAAKADSSGY